jgi:hypothetical protein
MTKVFTEFQTSVAGIKDEVLGLKIGHDFATRGKLFVKISKYYYYKDFIKDVLKNHSDKLIAGYLEPLTEEAKKSMPSMAANMDYIWEILIGHRE